MLLGIIGTAAAPQEVVTVAGLPAALRARDAALHIDDTDTDLAKLEFILNHRPRRVLGDRTPSEVFDQLRRRHAG